jgi:hypothetical protein
MCPRICVPSEKYNLLYHPVKCRALHHVLTQFHLHSAIRCRAASCWPDAAGQPPRDNPVHCCRCSQRGSGVAWVSDTVVDYRTAGAALANPSARPMGSRQPDYSAEEDRTLVLCWSQMRSQMRSQMLCHRKIGSTGIGRGGTDRPAE